MLNQFIRVRPDPPERSTIENTHTQLFCMKLIPIWVIGSIICILKRTLFSNVPGIAISAVNVGQHDGLVVPHIKENVLELLLNLKDVVLKGDLSEFTSTQHRLLGKLTYKGPGTARTYTLKFPRGITVVNNTHYIATVPNNITVELEVIIQRGKSYVIVESQDTSVLPPSFIAIDACFRPVIKAEFFLSPSNRHSHEIEKDFFNVNVRVTTNGSIAPLVAIQQASYIVKCILQELCLLNIPPLPLLRMEQRIQELAEIKQGKRTDIVLADIAIEELGLSSNAYNALKQVELNTLEDLFIYPEEGLLTIPGLSALSIDEIIRKLYICFRLRLSTLKDINKKI